METHENCLSSREWEEEVIGKNGKGNKAREYMEGEYKRKPDASYIYTYNGTVEWDGDVKGNVKGRRLETGQKRNIREGKGGGQVMCHGIGGREV